MAMKGGRRKPSMGFKRIRRKKCKLCVDKIKTVDYKNTDFLNNFITERGKIIPRRVNGNCAKHQRQLSVALKRARRIALLPYASD